MTIPEDDERFISLTRRWIPHVGSGRHCSVETHNQLVKTVKRLLQIIDTVEGDLGNER